MIKSNKGITMISLSIAVLLLIIISGVLVVNLKDGMEIKKFQNLKNDIEQLKDKATEYYISNGEIPILCKYTNTDNIGEKSINDNENYYVLDLSLLKNVSLTYGREYDKVKKYCNSVEENNIDQEEINKYTNIYIINEESLNIYYPSGIQIVDIKYYTNEVDKTNIELENIEEQE